MAKRFGYLVHRIVDRSNMNRAFDKVVDKLKEPRRTYYRSRRESIIDRLTKEIADGTFRVKGYQEMLVTDGPKIRLVQSPCVTDRIGCNAIMHIIENVLYPSIIKTSAASIPGRGMHKLFTKMRHDIESNSEGTRFFYKCDVKKFFESIDQEVMWKCVRRYIKDPIILPILHDFITLMPKGLSIGLRSSQCYGNIILSFLDHYFKDELGVKYYYRYCDDIVILADSKSKLWMFRDIVHEKVAKIGLQIKPNESVKPIEEGIDFLGFVFDGTMARLRKRTKQKAARKLAKVQSRKRRQEIIGSLKGMAKWGDCKKLYKKLTGRKMTEFNEIGMHYVAEDGKKRFTGQEMKLSKLVNKHIAIIDFEEDVQTKNGLRTLVSYRNDDGSFGKYFTADKQQLWFLKEFRKIGKIPFGTVIDIETYGNGKVRYIFT